MFADNAEQRRRDNVPAPGPADAPRTALPFVKMTGGGNDFIVVDDRGLAWQGKERALARALCPRGTSVGADGLILVRGSKRADASMVYINADGNEAALCGNGGRCVARYLNRTGLAGRRLTLETGAGLTIAAVVDEPAVRLELAPVSWPPESHTVTVDAQPRGKRSFAGHALTVGVPHFVHFLSMETLEGMDVERWGAAVRRNRLFGAEGTNVNFAAPSAGAGGELSVRTYERGVEAETLACGTGCAAAALLALRRPGFSSPVRCRTRGGAVLLVHVDEGAPPPGRVMLEGEARWVHSGEVDPEIVARL